MDCEQGEFIKRNLCAVVNSTSSTDIIIIIYLFLPLLPMNRNSRKLLCCK